jgi:hypothetical protein
MVHSLKKLIIRDYFKKIQRVSKTLTPNESDTFICEKEKSINDKMHCQSQLACPKELNSYIGCINNHDDPKKCVKYTNGLMRCLGTLNNKLIYSSVSLLFKDLSK